MSVKGSLKDGADSANAINLHSHSLKIAHGALVSTDFAYIAADKPPTWKKNDAETGFANGLIGRD